MPHVVRPWIWRMKNVRFLSKVWCAAEWVLDILCFLWCTGRTAWTGDSTNSVYTATAAGAALRTAANAATTATAVPATTVPAAATAAGTTLCAATADTTALRAAAAAVPAAVLRAAATLCTAAATATALCATTTSAPAVAGEGPGQVQDEVHCFGHRCRVGGSVGGGWLPHRRLWPVW